MVSVHQGLASGMSRPSGFPWPFPPPSLLLQSHPRSMFPHRRLCRYIPFPYCVNANLQCSGCEESKSFQGLGSRRLREIRRQCQFSPMGIASQPHPWFSQELPVGCHLLMPLIMPETLVLLLTFLFSSLPLPLDRAGSHL